jgi:hypothetical protein
MLFPTQMRGDYRKLVDFATARHRLMPDRVPRKGCHQRNRTGFLSLPVLRRWETAEGRFTVSLACQIWCDAHTDFEFGYLISRYGKAELKLVFADETERPRFSFQVVSSYSTRAGYPEGEMSREGWAFGWLPENSSDWHARNVPDDLADAFLQLPRDPWAGRMLIGCDGAGRRIVPEDIALVIATNAVNWLAA